MPPANRKNPTRAKSSESKYSLMEFMQEFPDDETCLQWLWESRCAVDDPDHAHCPKCGEVRKFARYATSQQRQCWTCTACGQHVHPTAGTIFHKSSTSLHLWFYAIYLMSATRCGISAKQLERELGVTYKTAWRMAKLIREQLMKPNDDKLSGEVEADETIVGGHRRGQHNRLKNKSIVFGTVQRGGKVRAMVVPDQKSATLLPHVQTHVLKGSHVFTDEWQSYLGLGKRGYFHKRIRHSAKIYVDGNVHTNTIEGFWSLLKGGIGGVYHSVSAKYLQNYLNEYAWRYNHRNADSPMFLLLLGVAAAS